MAASPAPNWKNLRPHVPLGPGDAAYEPRPPDQDIIPKLEGWLKTGAASAHFLVGCAGVGKSTELARLEHLLSPTAVRIHYQFGVGHGARNVAEWLARLAKRVADEVESDAKAPLVVAAENALWQSLTDPARSRHADAQPDVEDRKTRRHAENAMVEAIRAMRKARGACTLLIDGLERAPSLVWSSVLDSFEPFLDEASFVVVVPVEVLWGGRATALLGGRAKTHAIRPIRSGGDSPHQMFARLLLKRLGCDLPASLDVVVHRASEMSGGVPRTFLQLMEDAHMNAVIRGGLDWPETLDLDEASHAMADGMRYLLMPGDDAKLKANQDKDGRDLDPGDRVRFIAHGFLLETTEHGNVQMEVHPLLRAVL